MPHRSTLQDHPHRASIDAQLRAGNRPLAELAREFGVHYDALWRYRRRIAALPVPRVPRDHTPADAETFFAAATGKVPLPWQQTYLAETRHLALLKGRQIGASTAAAAVALRLCRDTAGVTALAISPSQRQSGEILQKARQMALFGLGWDLRSDSASMLQLDNGSRLISLPGSDTSIRGYAPHFLLIDEASWVVDAVWIAAQPMVIASGGRIICQSTPAGRVGWFYSLAEDPPPGWAFLRVPTAEAGTVSAEALDRQRATMPPDEFAMEYLADFGAGGGAGLFDAADVAALFEPAR